MIPCGASVQAGDISLPPCRCLYAANISAFSFGQSLCDSLSGKNGTPSPQFCVLASRKSSPLRDNLKQLDRLSLDMTSPPISKLCLAIHDSFANASAEYPAKTTLWTAPILAHAIIVTTASGIIGKNTTSPVSRRRRNKVICQLIALVFQL